MLRRTICIAACICLLLTALGYAEERKDEWADKAFDFKAVRTIVVKLVVADGITLGEIDRKRLDDLVATQIIRSGEQRVRFITAAQLEDSIGKIIQADMGLLRLDDKEKYNAALSDYAPKLSDASLTVTVKALSTTEVYVPASTYTYTTYQTTYVSVPNYTPHGGVYYTTQAVQVPVQQVGVTPAHYEHYGHAGAEFTLARSSDGQKIWLLVDMRDGKEKVPLEMTERIFKRAMDQFRDVSANRFH